MRSNNLRSAHRIWPGQRLKIPIRGAVASAPSGPSFNPVEGTHTVRRGESLYSIARRYNTTVAKLQQDNNLGSNLIKPGQKLQIRPGSRKDLRRYQVQPGDTLGAIAERHNVGLSVLLRANGLSSRSTIYPGQWLAIPD
jgi:LysM repeat protein